MLLHGKFIFFFVGTQLPLFLQHFHIKIKVQDQMIFLLMISIGLLKLLCSVRYYILGIKYACILWKPQKLVSPCSPFRNAAPFPVFSMIIQKSTQSRYKLTFIRPQQKNNVIKKECVSGYLYTYINTEQVQKTT